MVPPGMWPFYLCIQSYIWRSRVGLKPRAVWTQVLPSLPFYSTLADLETSLSVPINLRASPGLFLNLTRNLWKSCTEASLVWNLVPWNSGPSDSKHWVFAQGESWNNADLQDCVRLWGWSDLTPVSRWPLWVQTLCYTQTTKIQHFGQVTECCIFPWDGKEFHVG